MLRAACSRALRGVISAVPSISQAAELLQQWWGGEGGWMQREGDGVHGPGVWGKGITSQRWLAGNLKRHAGFPSHRRHMTWGWSLEMKWRFWLFSVREREEWREVKDAGIRIITTGGYSMSYLEQNDSNDGALLGYFVSFYITINHLWKRNCNEWNWWSFLSLPSCKIYQIYANGTQTKVRNRIFHLSLSRWSVVKPIILSVDWTTTVGNQDFVWTTSAESWCLVVGWREENSGVNQYSVCSLQSVFKGESRTSGGFTRLNVFYKKRSNSGVKGFLFQCRIWREKQTVSHYAHLLLCMVQNKPLFFSWCKLGSSGNPD